VKPLWQRWVVENPVFRYHLLGQTRLAVARPLWQVLAVASPFAAIYFWLAYQVATNGLPSLVIGLEIFALWLLAPLMFHPLFAMEFEKATWEMLVLTRLTAGQIVMGKFLSRLVMLLVFAFLFTPLLWIAANREFSDMTPSVMLLWGLKVQWVIFSWAILVGAVTLWLSYHLRRGMVAAAASFAGQVFVLFIFPIFWSLFLTLLQIAGAPDPSYLRIDTLGRFTWFFAWSWLPIAYNPIVAVVGVFWFRTNPDAPFLWGTWQGIVYLSLAVVVLWTLMVSVARATRKRLL
jgi:ABC-type transport system involved in multi-copper enzyme maturation permease subunit